MQYSTNTLNTYLCVLNSNLSKAAFFFSRQFILLILYLYFSLFLKIDDNFFTEGGVEEEKIKSDSTGMRFRLIMPLFESSFRPRAQRVPNVIQKLNFSKARLSVAQCLNQPKIIRRPHTKITADHN